MEPTLLDGDMILVDMSQKQFNSNQIYVLNCAEGLITKRLKNRVATLMSSVIMLIIQIGHWIKTLIKLRLLVKWFGAVVVLDSSNHQARQSEVP